MHINIIPEFQIKINTFIYVQLVKNFWESFDFVPVPSPLSLDFYEYFLRNSILGMVNRSCQTP
jgi:hypothetical protein